MDNICRRLKLGVLPMLMKVVLLHSNRVEGLCSLKLSLIFKHHHLVAKVYSYHLNPYLLRPQFQLICLHWSLMYDTVTKNVDEICQKKL